MKSEANTAVRILPGAAGIREAYAESLTAEKLDIVCLSENYVSVIGDYFDKVYAPQLYGKVNTREILPDTPGNRSDARKKDPAVNQVRFIKPEKSESDYLLFGDTAILVSYNPDQPFALVINDPNLVANLRSQFAALWNGLN